MKFVLFLFIFSKKELNSDDHNIKYHNYSEIEWPQDFGDFFDEKEKDSTEGDMIRPDSGVGESVIKKQSKK